MAFTETYHCDVCGNPRGDAEDWWLAMTEPASLIPTAPEQPMLKLTQWNILLSHAAKVRHLCGARCAQTRFIAMQRHRAHANREILTGA